ncbi:hypothetical protein GCM10010335_68210 [Streptomyces galbus]|nr:hypothetical protein GCM10010335_68210 [Streptomyces galbus]
MTAASQELTRPLLAELPQALLDGYGIVGVPLTAGRAAVLRALGAGQVVGRSTRGWRGRLGAAALGQTRSAGGRGSGRRGRGSAANRRPVLDVLPQPAVRVDVRT